MQLKDKLTSMSEEEQLMLLATHGMLVKRPLVVNGDTVLVGFKEAEWAGKIELINFLEFVYVYGGKELRISYVRFV